MSEAKLFVDVIARNFASLSYLLFAQLLAVIACGWQITE